MVFQGVVSTMSEKSEGRDLIRRCEYGDEQAWEILARSVTGRVFCLTRRFTSRREDAEDLTQEVLFRVYRKMSQFREGEGSLQAWVMAIARNTIIDHYRQGRHRCDNFGTDTMERLNLPEERSPDPLHAAECTEASEMVHNGLQRLPPDLRQAVLLRDIEGMEYHEIAAGLNVPEGTVKSRVNRAHRRLAKIMGASVRGRKSDKGNFAAA